MRMALLALSVPALCLAQAPQQPRLTLEAPDFDFGKIAPDTVVTHRFQARNTGNATLTIYNLNPTCGCTSTVVGKKTLAPGENTELEVTFNAAGQSGRTRKSVQVVTDDPVAQVQTLNFEAEVLPVVTPNAKVVQLEDLVRTDRRKTSVKLTSGTSSPIRVADVTFSDAPWLGVTTREAGKDLWLDLDLLAAKLPPSKLSGDDTITLRLLNPGPSVVNIGVHWELRPPVSVTPARVAWAEPAGQELHATVLLAQPQNKPFRILAAKTTNPLFKLAAVPTGAAARQSIEVVMSPVAPAGVYDEKAILTLDTPGHPELEIRLAASLR
jgi:hypothetical protein